MGLFTRDCVLPASIAKNRVCPKKICRFRVTHHRLASSVSQEIVFLRKICSYTIMLAASQVTLLSFVRSSIVLQIGCEN